MPLKDVVPYIVLQILGGFLGIATIAGIMHGSTGGWQTSLSYGFGSQCYSGNGSGCGFSLGSVFLIELALTFVFVLVIQLVTRPENSARNLAPVAIGLALGVDGASMNPVRSFAPALLTAMVGGGPSWPIEQSWLFWVAPILGGLLAGAVEMWLRPKP
jgi:aquaporin Z